MTNISTTTPPPDIEAASRGLAAVLASEPEVDAQLAAAEALSILSDVIPPYPPLVYPSGADADVDVERAIDEILAHLSAARDAARTVEQALRCGNAGRVLAAHRRRSG